MDSIPLSGPYSLRPLCADDAPAIFTAIDTQRQHLGPWLPFVATTRHEEQTRQVVAMMLADSANPIFTLRSRDLFAGLIGFKGANTQPGVIEIGYWLREEQQGKGMVTQAVKALCQVAFTRMGMHTVMIRCGAGNERSNRVPQRLGFCCDRVEVRGEQLSSGEWIDLCVYLLHKPLRQQKTR